MKYRGYLWPPAVTHSITVMCCLLYPLLKIFTLRIYSVIPRHIKLQGVPSKFTMFLNSYAYLPVNRSRVGETAWVYHGNLQKILSRLKFSSQWKVFSSHRFFIPAFWSFKIFNSKFINGFFCLAFQHLYCNWHCFNFERHVLIEQYHHLFQDIFLFMLQ